MPLTQEVHPLSAISEAPAAAPALPPPAIVLQAATAFMVSACLSVVCKLRIADLLGDGAETAATLAERAHANPEYLFRVLRALEGQGLFRRTEDGRFALTAAGALLRSDAEGSLADMTEWLTDPLHLSLFGELRGTVESGGITFDRVHGEPFFPWTCKPENADEAAIFNSAMTSLSQMCVPAFLEAYDFSGLGRVTDVGGGHGALLRAILKKYPEASGTVAEMACVVPETRVAIEADGLAGRCDAVDCDFFEAVPAGADCYILKNIIHDWEDRLALKILRNVRAGLAPHGRLLLAEVVLSDGPEPHLGKLMDIEMMTFVGGKERTESEFRALLAEAGFHLRRVVPTKTPLSLIEAVPA